MSQTHWADRGRQLRFDTAALPASGSCFGLTRLGGASAKAGLPTAWLQLRGHGWVEAREGRFDLLRGDWIIFERDSAPQVQVDGRGLCLGIVMDPAAVDALEKMTGGVLYPGFGHLSPGARLTALRLWRGAGSDADLQTLRPLLLFLMEVEHELSARVQSCPGRSRSHKRQVFGRMQRARLYLEGHRDQVVRMEELARMANFSSWYFSKAFHALYGESPQALCARLRLERAAWLLRSTPMMIGEVAAASGFDNCCSFARAFRARHGVSASEYRQLFGTDSGQDRQSEPAMGATPAHRAALTV
ncbi:helix-turn-helix domain-containing protein [Luteimonas sp. A277]